MIINFMVLALIDLYAGKGRIMLRLSKTNVRTGYYIVAVLSIISLFSILRTTFLTGFALGGLGIESLVIVCVYLAALKSLKQAEDGAERNKKRSEGSFVLVWGKFILLLIAVMGLGAFMAVIGEEIAATTGLSQTFTGSLFLGLSTSLPEIIVSIAALNSGSINMAVGNVLGSNLFDACIVPLLDLLCDKPILSLLSKGQILFAFIVLVMSVIFVLSRLFKKDTSKRINVDTGMIFLIGLAGFVVIYYVK